MAPPHMRLLDKGKGIWVEGDSDGEEDMESGERGEGGRAISEQAQRLEQAGEYKHVNTLLHDLHAEQRHRMLFSSSPHCQMSPFDQDPEFNPPFAAPPHKLASSPSHPTPHHHIAREAQGLTPSFTISIPSQDPEPVDFTEVQRVTQTYQDTNRYVRQLQITPFSYA